MPQASGFDSWAAPETAGGGTGWQPRGGKAVCVRLDARAARIPAPVCVRLDPLLQEAAADPLVGPCSLQSVAADADAGARDACR